MENLEWLRERMQDHNLRSAPMGRSEGVLRFPSASRSAGTKAGDAALELVYRAAEVVRDIEDRASENEKYAKTIAEKAVEKLQFAERRIQELETERRTAERFLKEAAEKIRAIEEDLKLERTRVAAAETQLHHIELRASEAEALAKESETALARIEEAIRTQLLRQRHSGLERSTAVA